MKCPNCSADMIGSRKGWLCPSCGHLEKPTLPAPADVPVTAAADSSPSGEAAAAAVEAPVIKPEASIETATDTANATSDDAAITAPAEASASKADEAQKTSGEAITDTVAPHKPLAPWESEGGVSSETPQSETSSDDTSTKSLEAPAESTSEPEHADTLAEDSAGKDQTDTATPAGSASKSDDPSTEATPAPESVADEAEIQPKSSEDQPQPVESEVPSASVDKDMTPPDTSAPAADSSDAPADDLPAASAASADTALGATTLQEQATPAPADDQQSQVDIAAADAEPPASSDSPDSAPASEATPAASSSTASADHDETIPTAATAAARPAAAASESSSSASAPDSAPSAPTPDSSTPTSTDTPAPSTVTATAPAKKPPLTPTTHPRPINAGLIVGIALVVILALVGATLAYAFTARPAWLSWLTGQNAPVATPTPTPTPTDTPSPSPSTSPAVQGATTSGASQARDEQRKADLASLMSAYRASATNGFYPVTVPANKLILADPLTGQPYVIGRTTAIAVGQVEYRPGGACSGPGIKPGATGTRYLALLTVLEDGHTYCIDNR